MQDETRTLRIERLFPSMLKGAGYGVFVGASLGAYLYGGTISAGTTYFLSLVGSFCFWQWTQAYNSMVTLVNYHRFKDLVAEYKKDGTSDDETCLSIYKDSEDEPEES